MKIGKCFYLLIVFLYVCFFPFSSNAQQTVTEDKNNYILILSSYSYENEWATTVSKSIRSELEKKNPKLLVNITYADIAGRQSYISGRFGMQTAFANARLSPTIILPSVLILVGEEAWMYYRIMNLRGLWENIPVLLVGVRNTIIDDYSTFFEHGTLEESRMIPLEESFEPLSVRALVEDENEACVLELMNKLIPDMKELYFLMNKTNYQDQYVLGQLKLHIQSKYPKITLHVAEPPYNTDSVQAPWMNAQAQAALLVNSCSVPQNVAIPVFTCRDSKLSGKSLIGGCYSSTNSYVAQASDIIMDIYESGTVDSISPLTKIKESVPHLNKTAIEHWGMDKYAVSVDNVAFENIPLPFYLKYMRILFISLLMLLVFVIVFILIVRAKRYRNSLKDSFEQYKRLYEEYQIIYRNIPVGLVLMDEWGNILRHNPGADEFLKTVTSKKISELNLFNSKIVDSGAKEKIKKREYVNLLYNYKDYCFRIIFKYVGSELGSEGNILMIVLDSSEIEKEKKAKEEVNAAFNFAMNASFLGLAEYNLLDGHGFATEAWYRNLGIAQEDDFLNVHVNVVEEDREIIDEFLANIHERKNFIGTIRVCVNGETHWLRYGMTLVEYAPDKERILVVGLALNIDKQKYREAELAKAIAEAAELDRMKNTFIANMSSDIRPSLQNLVTLSAELIQVKDKSRKQELLEQIEYNNDILLQYIRKIIHLSQADKGKLENL